MGTDPVRATPAPDTTRMRIFALGLTLGAVAGFIAAAVAAIGAIGQ